MPHKRPNAHTATIKQVAARAGVSPPPVSRAFADADAVSKTLRDRVYKVAKALNYRPSRVARNLRVGRAQAVGVVIPDLQNPFFTSLVRGVEGILQAAGYTLLLANADESPAREHDVLATFRAEGVAGIIFVP